MRVEWLFLAVSWGCLRFVIVVFPGHTHLLCLDLRAANTQTSLRKRTIAPEFGAQREREREREDQGLCKVYYSYLAR